ncbi:MAG: alcohol dehydrogenase catalytic domain-containing protein [Oscillospiraceae bacterium]|nr:alcohol dehydrogenase catalytic domain-containing protein [Oscillospiraceae bacterium]
MKEFMKAIVLEAPNSVKMTEIPVPVVGAGEILVQTKAGTVCTSDIMDIKHGLFAENLPMVMGHEAAGVVVAIGDDVTGIYVDDEVAVHPVMSCYECASCNRGLSHLCEKMEHLCFNRPGVFAEYFVTRPDCVRKIPSGMSFPVASLMEPVCVCLEALNRGNVKQGDRVLIAGDGPFGIMISRLCALKKPRQVIQTGFYDYRLKQAGRFVHTINVNDKPDLNKTILDLTEREGIDCAILCVSEQSAVDLCIDVLRPRGIMVIFSALSGKTPVDLMSVHLKELNIVGSNNDENYMDEAIKLLGDPDMRLNDIITHEIPFSKWEEAFFIADQKKESCLKVSMIV